jgi:monooxygenase
MPAHPEHVDVLIVGAGLSGVGAAAHLQDECPGTTWAILEAREAIGGTWDLFRYPGVRSDSDMFTLGYAFRPWTDTTAIAEGAAIRDYIRETAGERGIDAAVRFGHRVVAAEWSTATARWTVTVEARGRRTMQLTCGFLFFCAGYYRYDRGHEPVLPGAEQFAGRVVHPQSWPDDLDCTGRRVVVVGSGATAVTLVPALAQTAAHVTMLQRSPSYVLSLPARDPLAARLFARLPARLAAPVVRAKNVALTTLVYRLSRRFPTWMRQRLLDGVRAQLPAGFAVDEHFSPAYDPWDQRLCIVPDGDLFRSVRAGRASVVTDRIATLTRHGVALESGTEVPADIVVTATGLSLQMLGGATLRVDSHEVDLARTVAYRGAMLSGVPNLALTLGYTSASWTLRADLVATYVCRLLRYLRAHGQAVVTPVDPPTTGLAPLIGLRSGYVRRAAALLPRQGSDGPWRLRQSYPRELLTLRHGRIDDGHLRFAPAPTPTGRPATAGRGAA